MTVDPSPKQLRVEYALRFSKMADYRRAVWRVLLRRFFQPLVGLDQVVLDLGCGWGEFINQVSARTKYGMDLNPESRARLDPSVNFLEQDCSTSWPLPNGSLDVVFTSNFFEHLLSKDHLSRTVAEVKRCLKPGGRLICLGPNIRYVGGAYWDFFDHHLPLTEKSLAELLRMHGLVVERCWPRFLPYTMADGTQPPLWCVSLYLAWPICWRFVGRQFLVVARNSETTG